MMGSGPMLLGHSHPAVIEAVIKAVEQGSTFFATNDKAVLLAEALVDAIPCAEQVRFTTSGTDACFQAMRIARAYKGREKVLKFEGGYHGTSRLRLHERLARSRRRVPPVSARHRWHSQGDPGPDADCPFNDLETTESIIRAHHDELAAVIVEPMQRVLAPQPGFLQASNGSPGRTIFP